MAVLLAFAQLMMMPAYAEESAGEGDSDRFEGSRNLSFVIDRSDIFNFIDGGHKSFCTPFEQFKDWLKLEYTIGKVDIVYTMSFAFSSRQDYIDKLSSLLTVTPIIVKDNDNYIEGFESIEMLNFVQIWLQTNNRIYERQFEDLVLIKDSVLRLNGNEYSSKEAIKNIGNALQTFSKIRMSTVFDDRGYPIRQIELTPSNGSAGKNRFLHRAKEIDGLTLTDYDEEYLVRMTGTSLKEIAAKTMQLFCIPVSISMNYVDTDNGIMAEYYEYLPTSLILEEEEEADYSISFNDFYGDVVAVKGRNNKDMRLSSDSASCTGRDIQVRFGVYTGLPVSRMETTLQLSSSDDTVRTHIVLYYPVRFSDKYREYIRYILSMYAPESARYEELSNGVNARIALDWISQDGQEAQSNLSDFYGKDVSVNYRRAGSFGTSVIAYDGYAASLPLFQLPFESNSFSIVLPDHAKVKDCSGGKAEGGRVAAEAVKTVPQENEYDEWDDNPSGEVDGYHVIVYYRNNSYVLVIVIIAIVVLLLGLAVALLILVRRNKARVGKITGKVKDFFSGLTAPKNKASAVPPAVNSPGVNPPAVNSPGVNPPAVNSPGVNPPAVNPPAVNPPGVNPPPVNPPAAIPEDPVSQPEMVKICPVCGEQNNVKMQFCGNCGETLPAAVPIDLGTVQK